MIGWDFKWEAMNFGGMKFAHYKCIFQEIKLTGMNGKVLFEEWMNYYQTIILNVSSKRETGYSTSSMSL